MDPSDSAGRDVDMPAIHSDACHMRTTIRIDRALLERARQEAASRGVTLASLIEQGLCLVLRRPLERIRRLQVILPECHVGGGLMPGVDLDASAAVVDRMEGRT